MTLGGGLRAHASSFETALTRLLRMTLIGVSPVETAAAHSVLILRSPPRAGVSKDGRRARSKIRDTSCRAAAA